MEHRSLGRSGLHVLALAFGTAAFGVEDVLGEACAVAPTYSPR